MTDPRLEQAIGHLHDFNRSGDLDDLRAARRAVGEVWRDLTETPEARHRRVMKRVGAEAAKACGMTAGKRQAIGMVKGRTR